MAVFIEPPFWATRTRTEPSWRVSSVIVTPPAEEPLTLDEAKLRAGLDWTAGDPRDDLMNGFIAAARSKVEQDTGLALLTQTRDVFFDTLSMRRDGTVTLPAQSRPLQSVGSVKVVDTAGTVVTVEPANYIVDLATARLGLAPTGVWPSDARPFQPWVVRIVSGWLNKATLRANAPLLFHAVGLLIAHYATVGRDLTTVGTIITTTPEGYDDAIAPYIVVSMP